MKSRYTGIFFILILAGGLLSGCQKKDETGTYDDREAIHLTSEERAYFLQEMREFLFSVNGVLAGVSSRDYEIAYDSARKSGASFDKKYEDLLKNLEKKLPPKFNTLRAGTHADFDRLADGIQKRSDNQVMSDLTNISGKCVACHSLYRVVAD